MIGGMIRWGGRSSLALALGLALGAAACGGGGDDDGVDSAAIDATAGDAAGPDAPNIDAAPPAACADSGHACTWLGRPGEDGFNGDGHHRLSTVTYWPFDMVFQADGTPWFIDWNNHQVRRVNADDTVQTMIGWTDPVFPGDGTGDATERSADGALGTLVQLNHPTDMVIGADGSILVMAWHNHKLRRIDPATGMVKILAGSGAGFAGDGAAAGAATLFKQPKALEIDAAGNLYIADQQNWRIRKVEAGSNNLSTIAGDGTQGYAGDGGPALVAKLGWEAGSNPEPSAGLAIAGDKLYVADTLNNRVRVVDLTLNTIDLVAGNGTAGYAGDGAAATLAQLDHPRDLEIGPEGDLYIADTDNHAIRAVNLTTGDIRTVVGTGVAGLGEEGLLATETQLRRPFGIQFDPDGNLYVSDTLNGRILKVIR